MRLQVQPDSPEERLDNPRLGQGGIDRDGRILVESPMEDRLPGPGELWSLSQLGSKSLDIGGRHPWSEPSEAESCVRRKCSVCYV